MKLTNVRADEIKIGDQMVERDGYLLTVDEIAKMPRGECVFFYLRYRRDAGRLMHKPVRPSTLIRVMR